MLMSTAVLNLHFSVAPDMLILACNKHYSVLTSYNHTTCIIACQSSVRLINKQPCATRHRIIAVDKTVKSSGVQVKYEIC